AVDAGGRADALLGPVVYLAGGELVVGGLPQQLAGLLLEAQHDALVALDLGPEIAAVVGADEDLAARDDRIAVRLRAQRRGPQDVPPGLHVPFGWDAGLIGDHVAVRGPAPHRPVAFLGLGVLGRGPRRGGREQGEQRE